VPFAECLGRSATVNRDRLADGRFVTLSGLSPPAAIGQAKVAEAAHVGAGASITITIPGLRAELEPELAAPAARMARAKS
jgi:hypothetical protein